MHNTCYTCHTKGIKPEYINDQELQLEYAFPLAAQNNPWTNFFKDHGSEAAAISDESILAYVRTSNYVDSDGRIALAGALKNPASKWDADNDGRWSG
ncbi:MAG: hypothetical protein PVG81_06630 [Desulfobacterales bacterium]